MCPRAGGMLAEPIAAQFRGRQLITSSSAIDDETYKHVCGREAGHSGLHNCEHGRFIFVWGNLAKRAKQEGL